MLSSFPSWLDCITNTSGYDFRKGQGTRCCYGGYRKSKSGYQVRWRGCYQPVECAENKSRRRYGRLECKGCSAKARDKRKAGRETCRVAGVGGIFRNRLCQRGNRRRQSRRFSMLSSLALRLKKPRHLNSRLCRLCYLQVCSCWACRRHVARRRNEGMAPQGDPAGGSTFEFPRVLLNCLPLNEPVADQVAKRKRDRRRD